MPRSRLVINVGNLLELLGAVAACVGVGLLAGLAFALILAGILLVVGAELIYDQHVWRVPLPHRPRPRVWLAVWRRRMRRWSWPDRMRARLIILRGRRDAHS
jgi:hypothetical protein